jgi:hypothetical protein
VVKMRPISGDRKAKGPHLGCEHARVELENDVEEEEMYKISGRQSIAVLMEVSRQFPVRNHPLGIEL